VITCPNCGKDNQDRHKFCLGCGARLPPTMEGAPGYPPSYPPPVPSAGPPPPPPPPPPPVGPYGQPPGPAVVGIAAPPGPPPPPPPPLPDPMASAPPRPGPSGPTAAGVHGGAGAAGPCPTCGFGNPPGFQFCGRCGQRLQPPAMEPASPAQVEDVGSANTVFVSDAPAELRQAAQAFRNDATGGLTPPAGEFAPISTAAGQPAPPSAVPSPPPPPPSSSTQPGAQGAVPRGGTAPNPAIPPTAPAPVIGVAAKLIMLGPDGQPLGERLLSPGETLEIGRDCGPPWDEDAYLDRKHGSLVPGEDGIEVFDHGSLNGIFVKLHERAELQDGDQFRVGQELLLYEDLPEPTPTDDGTERMGSPNPGYWGRLSLLVDPDSASAAYPIHGEGLTVGRENGDITFPGDGYVSGTHCRIYGDDNGVYVEDVGSSNGTYMRVRTGSMLPYGSLVLIGQKLFQFERQ
jgi:hypothetical protein